MRGKAVVQRNFKYAAVSVTQVDERKSKLPVPQIILELHARYFTEFP